MARIWQQGFEIPYRYYSNYPPVGTFNYEDYSIITKSGTGFGKIVPSWGVASGRSTISNYALCFGLAKSVDNNPSCCYLQYSFATNYNELYYRIWFKTDTGSTPTNIFNIYDSYDILVFNMTVTPYETDKFTLSFTNGTTSFFTTAPISSNTWCKLDFYINTTNDTIIIKINDKIVTTYSNALSGENMSYFILGFTEYVKSNQHIRQFYFDDIAINDVSGSKNNSWCGNGTIVALQPIENGSLCEFAPLSGSNYENIDEITAPDGDTSYNSIAEGEKTDLFKIKKLSDYNITDTTKINAISFVATAKFDESTSAIAPIIKGTSTTEGNKTTILGEYTSYNLGLYDVNPETSSTFTAKDLSDLEFGYRSKEV